MINPGLWIVRPAAANGLSVLVIPGGGYEGLALDREGFLLAETLAETGATAFVLEHRLPSEGWSDGPFAPLRDARRALALIRSQRASHHHDRTVALCGASAGGHLALLLAHKDAPTLFGLMLFYPLVTMRGPLAYARCRTALLGAAADDQQARLWSPLDLEWTTAPPTLIVQAADDPVAPLGGAFGLSARLSSAPWLRLKVLKRGGHGFIGRGAVPSIAWSRPLSCFASSRSGQPNRLDPRTGADCVWPHGHDRQPSPGLGRTIPADARQPCGRENAP